MPEAVTTRRMAPALAMGRMAVVNASAAPAPANAAVPPCAPLQRDGGAPTCFSNSLTDRS